MGFSELLSEQVKDKDMEGIEKYADIIVQASGKAMNLLMNLMEWSRSQTGRMTYAPSEIVLNEIVGQTCDLLNAAALQKTIAISNTLEDEVWVFADQAMLSTILRNLISNAIKYTKPGGMITVRAKKEKNEVLISVSDTGVGIPQNMIERLFRIDDSYTTNGTQDEQGTGLGLILCREFIEKHGGKIGVESTPGKGTSFYFTIPAKLS
jgi:signal transduction histidine kinase